MLLYIQIKLYSNLFLCNSSEHLHSSDMQTTEMEILWICKLAYCITQQLLATFQTRGRSRSAEKSLCGRVVFWCRCTDPSSPRARLIRESECQNIRGGKGDSPDEKSLQLAGRSLMSCNYFYALGIEIGPSVKESRRRSQPLTNTSCINTSVFADIQYSILMDLMTNPHVNQNWKEWCKVVMLLTYCEKRDATLRYRFNRSIDHVIWSAVSNEHCNLKNDNSFLYYAGNILIGSFN